MIQLELGDPAVPLADDLVGDIPFQRDTEDVLAAEPKRLAHRPVHAVRSYEHVCLDALAVDT